MDTSTLRQRPKNSDDKRAIREKKLVKAKRGLRSLSIAVTLPLIFSLLSSFLSPPLPPHSNTEETIWWYPPAWLIHAASAVTSGLMGLAAWLFWAEGGMRRSAGAACAGAGGVGVAVAGARVAALVACGSSFRRVNPFAGNLVTPCAAWAAFAVFLSYKLM
ncbi:translocator protein homolog [Phalaenopsis equestris]|uniref:translocator protein homolog n=1 Tax=Phalaenopsis equestris TaxID=78828 RepID=UPI0009E60A2B|nr:translocator protein homolog [Phalaenopsis equestris]